MSTLETKTQGARAQSVQITEDALVVGLMDGRVIQVPLTWYPRLWYGTEAERAHFEITGEGEYLHWPDLDEDLSVSGMLAGHPSGESAASLKNWLARREAQKGPQG
jgi:hypothetical protein